MGPDIYSLLHQGRIAGHATSNSANIDSIVLNVTKNRGLCAACIDLQVHTYLVYVST